MSPEHLASSGARHRAPNTGEGQATRVREWRLYGRQISMVTGRSWPVDGRLALNLPFGSMGGKCILKSTERSHLMFAPVATGAYCLSFGASRNAYRGNKRETQRAYVVRLSALLRGLSK